MSQTQNTAEKTYYVDATVRLTFRMDEPDAAKIALLKVLTGTETTEEALKNLQENVIVAALAPHYEEGEDSLLRDVLIHPVVTVREETGGASRE